VKFLERARIGQHPQNVKCFVSIGLGMLLAASIAPAQSSTILPKEIEWKPVTSEQRWKIYRDKTYASPSAYFRAFGPAAGDQLNDRPLSWPQGVEGYSRRVGQRFVTFTMQDSLEAGLSAAARYEPRYVRCKCAGAGPRFAHAIKMNFLTYDDAGKQVLNWPKLVGAYGAGMLSTSWVKDYKWSAQGIQAGNTQISLGIFFNVAREFGPEIKRGFRRK
jgi:hypothetical protein